MQKQKTQDNAKRPDPTQQSKTDDINKEKQKAEEAEVAGRHKNDGRNDHVGHKVSR